MERVAAYGTGPAPRTYKKIKTHATSKGVDYEVKTSALLYLKGLNSGRRFQLASNALGVGAFDDILFRSLILGDSGPFWSSYFLQLKHKLTAVITYEALTQSSKGDFALLKYYDSFLESKQTMNSDNRGEMFDGKFEDCKFVIFTNALASKKLKDHEITKASENVDDVVKFGVEEFIFGLNGCEKIVSCLEGKSYAEDFLNKLMIFSGEPRVDKMDDLISEEILKINKCTVAEAKGITEILVNQFKEWCTNSNTIIDENSGFLNRAINKHKLDVSQSTQYERVFPLDLKFNESFVENMKRAVSERCPLLHIITEEHLIEVTCSKLLHALQALKKKSFTPTSLEWFLREKDAYLTVSETLLVIAADATQSTPADLAVMDDLCQVLIQEDTNKQVVFVSTVDNEFITRLKEQLGDMSKTFEDDFTLNQLTPESLENNLKTKITFQGREVEKRALVGGTSNSFQTLSSHISSFVVTDYVKNVTAVIGKEVSGSLEFFIPRTLHRRNYINMSIFKQSSLNGMFAISGITEGMLRTLIPYDDMKLPKNKNVTDCCVFEKSTKKSQFLVLSKDNAEEHFNQLAKDHPNIHWLHMEAGELTWKRSHGSVGDILEYVDEDRYTVYNPSNVLDLADRIVLLVAEPGMGKSTLLTHMARQIKEENPSDWVVLIKLSDHSDLLKDGVGKEFNAREFLWSVVKTSPLDKVLFEHNLANNNNVSVLIDGVDELSESCLKNCRMWLEHMVESNVKKIWVTSRQSRGHMLEILLSTISLSLQRFTLKEQKDFFKNCWRDVKTTMDKTQQVDFINKIFTLVSSSIGEQERPFAGIPLQTKMLAVIYEPYYAKEYISNLPESLSLLDIYEKFVETKYKIAFEKSGNKILNNEKCFRLYSKQSNVEHMAAALVVLLDNITLQCLDDKHLERVCDELVSDVISGEEKSGIVDRVVNGMPLFVHRIVSEYYAGIWLAENYQRNGTLLKTHFCTEEFRVIRNIFDRKLSRGNPLHTAVLNSDMSQVDRLLKSGTDVNSVDLGGRTCLHLAAAVGFRDSSESKVNLRIVNTLLDHGADIELYDTGVLKWTPLRYADETKAFDIIDLILKNKKAKHDDLKLTKQIIKDHLLLEVIIQNGFLSILDFLLTNGLDANAKLDIKDRPSLLHKAAEYGHVNVAQLLITRGADIISVDQSNSTPLRNSARYGHIFVAQLLLENLLGDQDEIRQHLNIKEFNIALLFAAAWGNVNIMSLLVSAGGNLETRTNKNSTLLHAAASKGHLTVAQFLLEKISDDQDVITEYVNARNTYGITALHLAAEGGHVDIMRLLVRKGGDLKALSIEGRTLLHISVITEGHLTVAQFLLASISDEQGVIKKYVNERDNDGNTALHWAAGGGHLEILRLLVSVGGDLKALGCNDLTLLHWAALKAHLSVANFLLEKISDDQGVIKQYVNVPDTYGNTALHCAAQGGHVDMLRLLVRVGGDLEALGYNDRSLLHWAALKGHLSVANFLLENISEDQDVIKQYVNVRDRDGNTALHCAEQGGHEDIMRLLVRAGGDLGALRLNGSTHNMHMAAIEGL